MACKTILKKIVKEKENEEIEKLLYRMNRDELRSRLLMRHETSIQQQAKIGIKSQYTELFDISQATRFKGLTNYSKDDNRVYSNNTIFA